MRIVYEPVGVSGYTCQLISIMGPAVTVDSAEGSAKVEVALADTPAQALVAAVERYAEHEYARRRTRNERKRRYHAKEASNWRDVTEDLAALLVDLTDTTEEGWCSDCMTKSDHRLARSKTMFGTRRYMCTACGSPTGWCDVPKCPHFADRGGSPTEGERFCAEHSHRFPRSRG